MLNKLGEYHKTDKASNGHNYLDFYERFLPGRDANIVLLEVGIGGYEYPDRGGESLRMWRKYYHNAAIIGVDRYYKNNSVAPECTLYQADQTDAGFFNELANYHGKFDVVIDDASHINQLSIQTFEILFPLLESGGVYIWEDVHTSLWPEEYNGKPEPMAPGTALHFLARLMYGLQADTIIEPLRGPWDGHIAEMHFMRNTCVIIKK